MLQCDFEDDRFNIIIGLRFIFFFMNTVKFKQLLRSISNKITQHFGDTFTMGVRRLFSRGGQNFPGGAKTYYLPKKHPKRYYFGRPRGGKGTVLPSPADAHDLHLKLQ